MIKHTDSPESLVPSHQGCDVCDKTRFLDCATPALAAFVIPVDKRLSAVPTLDLNRSAAKQKHFPVERLNDNHKSG